MFSVHSQEITALATLRSKHLSHLCRNLPFVIGHLNPPLPDEHLVSLIARYRSLFPVSDSDVCRDFFGVRKMHNIVNFPSRLDFLVRQIPQEFGLSAAVIVRNHTLLPFFAPFMAADDLKEVIAALRGKAVQSYLTRLFGVSGGCEYLRYCCECAQADRSGPQREAGWHRLPQLGAVKVCPDHNVFLFESQIRTSGRARFVAAEDAIKARYSVHRINERDSKDILYLWIAKQAAWLLSNGMSAAGRASDLQRAYTHCLRQEGLLTNECILRLDKFNQMICDRVGPDVLHELDCTLERDGDNWARRIVKGQAISPHPIKHLLLLWCFGLEIGEFLQLSSSKELACTNDFEPGPWPCLNPACIYRDKDVIATKQIRIDERNQLFGIFSCICGYTYSRRGPDPAGHSRHTVHKVISTGKAWDDTLTKLWMDRAIPVYEIGNTLKSYHYPIMQAVVRLGLPLNRPRLTNPPVVHKAERERQKEITRRTFREYFLAYIAKHPGSTRTQLQRSKWKIGHVVTWMAVQDRKWLWEHMPKRVSSTRGGSRRQDWERLDRELQAKVDQARGHLLSFKGRPNRISKNALLIELGFSHGLDRQRYPRTTAAVKAAQESLVECAARRVYWLLENSSSACISVQQLKRDARIRPQWEKRQEIAKALKDAVAYELKCNPAVPTKGSSQRAA
jgi:hypothetical protein